MSAVNDIQRGREALRYFHNEALKYPENYSMSLNELCDYYNSKTSGIFVENLGSTIAIAEIAESKVADAMMGLAQKGEGKLPVAWVSFFNALSGAATQVNFLEAFKETVSTTVEGIAEVTKEFAEESFQVTKDTLSNLGGVLKYTPYLLIAGAAFYIYLIAPKRR